MELPLDFEKGEGLIPVIIQDEASGRILMLGYINEEALKKTMETKKVHFFSRSRQKIWLKGETSGHFLEVVEIYVDCDKDTLLIKVKPYGPVCHEGYSSCFYRKLSSKGTLEIVEDKLFNPEEIYGEKA